MKEKHMILLSSWIVIVFLLLLIIPISVIKDFLGAIIIVAMIYAIWIIYLAFRGNDTQDMAKIEYDVSQLRDEVQMLNVKIDEIKRLVNL